MKPLLTLACMLILSLPSVAQDQVDQDVIVIAEEWLAAYSTFEGDRIEPHLHDEAVFYDPTSSTQSADGGPFIFEGKQAVVKALDDYAALYKSVSVQYDVERRYESEGHVVFIAQLTYNLVTKDEQTVTGTAPIVTVVTVKEGKILKHTDYFDYKGNAVDFSSE